MTALISVFIFNEGFNVYTILGIILIVVGVVILNLWGECRTLTYKINSFVVNQIIVLNDCISRCIGKR